MYAIRLVASFFAFGAISALATPTPVVEKREDVSDVLAIVGTLQSSTGSILPQIDSLVNTDQATEANLSPLLAQLVTALDTSAASFQSLNGKVDQNSGGSKEEVAAQVATVYTDISTSLNNVKTKKPHLYPLIPKHGLDAALLKVLLGLDLILIGVVKLVAVLLKSVAGLLSGLGFLLTILLLGLL